MKINKVKNKKTGKGPLVIKLVSHAEYFDILKFFFRHRMQKL